MKTINIPLEDEKYKALKKVKGNRTWHKFIDDIIKNEEINNKKWIKEGEKKDGE